MNMLDFNQINREDCRFLRCDAAMVGFMFFILLEESATSKFRLEE
jgi:hypothetical protein